MAKAKPGELEQIKALVSAATGIDPARGDQVQVIVRPFEPVADEPPPFWEAPWFAMVVRTVAALIALLLVLLLGVRPLVRALKREPKVVAIPAASEADAAEAEAETDAAEATSTRPVEEQEEEDEAARLGRKVGMAHRIVEEQPEEAVMALRQMLGTQPNEVAR